MNFVELNQKELSTIAGGFGGCAEKCCLPICLPISTIVFGCVTSTVICSVAFYESDMGGNDISGFLSCVAMGPAIGVAVGVTAYMYNKLNLMFASANAV